MDKIPSIPSSSTKRSKIKADNLVLMKTFVSVEVFDFVKNQMVPYFISASQPNHSLAPWMKNWEPQVFWLEVYHHYWPDNLEYGRMLTAVMSQMAKEEDSIGKENDKHSKKKKKKYLQRAVELLDFYKDKFSQDETYYETLHLFCTILIQAQERLGEALEFALMIPKDYTSQGCQWQLECLHELAATCREIWDEDCHPEKRPEVRDVLVKACQAMFDQNPQEMKAMFNLATAQLYADNFVQAVRLCRKVWASNDQLSPDLVEPAKRLLCLAQLQLPGMPLENYKVLFSSDTAMCLHKDHLDRGCVVDIPNPERPGTMTKSFRVEVGTAEDVDLSTFDVPTDPDDPEQWPPALFDMLANLEDEEG